MTASLKSGGDLSARQTDNTKKAELYRGAAIERWKSLRNEIDKKSGLGEGRTAVIVLQSSQNSQPSCIQKAEDIPVT
jgi:hypothetical protein